MKRIVFVLCLLLAAVPALPQAAQAPAKAGAAKKSAKAAGAGNAQAELEKLEKDRAEAVIHQDTTALDKMTADDYVLIDMNGKMRSKAETMDAIKSGAIKIQSNDIDDVNVHVYGNTAVVTGRSNAKGTIDGNEMSGPIRFTRVYVKRNGKWQSVAFQQTKIAQ